MNRNNITISILIAVAFIWAINTILTAVRPKILDIIEPSLRFSRHFTYRIKSFFLPETRLLKENKDLKEKLEIMKSKLVQLDELILENNRLRRLLELKKRLPYKTISCRVIGRDPSSWSGIIYIDKGINDGITKYMAVTTDKGLVGKVIEVGSTTAKVMFITDPDSRIGVLVQRTRDDGLLYGTLSGRCQMVYISLDADIWPGDLVITSGVGKSIPKGLLVGSIEDVFIDKSGLYQTAVIKPAVELSKIEEVLCIE